MIKDKEYESVGKNIFPIEYLSDEEKKELGILEKSCCKSKGRGCSGCSKGQGSSSCGGCKGCSAKDKEESSCGGCKGCGCSK